MSYFITLSGSPTKFSKAGFLLRSVGSILEERAIKFRAIHAVDLPPSEPTTRRIANQFIADTIEQIRQAAAIVLVTRHERKFTNAARFAARSPSGEYILEETCITFCDGRSAWAGRNPGTRFEADPVPSRYNVDCRARPHWDGKLASRRR